MLLSDEAREQWRIAKIRARRFLKEWDESKHPRVPAGSGDISGQFGYGGGGGGDDVKDRPEPAAPKKPSSPDRLKKWPKEDDGNAKKGDEIVVYRLADRPGLAGRNGGNSRGVGTMLERRDGDGPHAGRLQASDTIFAYRVLLTEDPGGYFHSTGGEAKPKWPATEVDESRVGRQAESGNVAYYFPKDGGGHTYEALDQVHVDEVYAKLKELGYSSAFMAEGTGKTAEAVRLAFEDSNNEREHPGEGYSKQAYVKDGVIHTSDVYDAVRALHEDRPVELDQPRTASVLIDKLGEISKEMIARGEKAPNFNLCRVTIKATSLFCADTMGIPRVEMPQFAKEQDKPFREYLIAKGYKVTEENQYASHLRATQNELNGSKVAAIANKMRSPGGYHASSNPIFVSDDDYILDGHHRWAAEVGVDAADNKLGDGSGKTMPIWRVDANITTLLAEAETFTEGKGKLAMGEDRKKQWALARAQAHELLKRFDPSQPRDEHGRWMDVGGSDDVVGNVPTTASYDTDKVEAKTKLNVAEASAKAKKDGTKPLEGSKAEHPATIATRNPTAKGKTATPKGAYGQPDTATMKLDPKRYDHDIGLFKNEDFYPNFRAKDLSGSTDKATANVVAQMKDNLKFLYQFADKNTQIWYDGARALVDDRAKLWGYNDASIAAVYAALSPTKDWDQNVHIADMLLQTYKNQQGRKWDDKMSAKAKTLWSKKLQPLVKLVEGKTLGELTDPAHKALWIRTFDETHNKQEYRTVLPNGALGKIVKNKDGTSSKVVWQSLPAITNAVKALEANGDREIISASMGTAHKVRSFYNNILDPHSANGDVTIDTHAVGAALLRQLSGSDVPVVHNFGNTPLVVDQPEGWDAAGSSSKTGLSGLYPVYAQAYREAAADLGIQPRQLQSAVWVVKRNTFGELSKKDQEAVEALWHSYHDDHKITLEHTRSEIAKILRLGKNERSYGDVERGGHRADARELYRGGVGLAVAAMDGGAGAGVAGRAAGLDAVRNEERGAGPEVVTRTSAHTDWMNECVPRLMDYGKDQITAVAACLNMWREQWEISHPDGADDPGPSPKEADPDSPLAEAAAERCLALARERLKVYNEADHPRDEYGRWTDGGVSDPPERAPAQAPAPPSARETASAKPIKGLPNDIVIKDHLLAQAQERDAFEMTAKEKGKEGSGRERYEVTVTAKIPKGVKSFESRPHRESPTYYDPELADLRTHNLGEKYIEFTVAEPKAGLSTEIEPLPDSDVIYRGMRAEEYEEFMRTGLIESGGTYNMEGQEGLTYWATDPATAASYANGFAPWPHKATFEKPAYVVATKRPKETRKVEGTGDNEVGVARPIAKTEIMGVWRGDVYQHTPGTADIKPSSYDPNESSYVGGSSSGVSSDVVWKRVGIGVDDIKKPGDSKETAAKAKATLTQINANATAVKLDFNPELIEYSNEDKEFTLAGMSYKYAGSYTRGESKVKLFNKYINSDSVAGITAHEIGHRKFELLRETYNAENKQVMEEPGPPPDPNHKYWWGKKGGKDAVMTPDGTLRMPYAEKYPVYQEWNQIQNMRPSLEQDDGITDYSKAYWSEWEKGHMHTDTAYHETMAEMSRNWGTIGGHSLVTGEGWKRLYALQERVWAATDKVKRDTSGPVKSIFIIDGIRWEIR